MPIPGSAAYFRGRTISLMVGYGPGGGTDSQARYMAREWPRFVPGNPNIVVRNLTPNVVERNFVWNAEPDGLTLALEASPGIWHLSDPQAQFDLRESTMIGITSGAEAVWLIRGTLPYDCIDDAFGATQPELTIGLNVSTPEELGPYVSIGWLADKFNVPLRIRNLPAVETRDQYLLLGRGDVNSWVSSIAWSHLPTTRPGWVSSGFVRPFADLSLPGFTVSHNGEGDFHCSHFHDTHLKDQNDRALWLAMRSWLTFGRHIVGPPSMLPGVTQALREALATAMADRQFAQGLEAALGVRNTYIDGVTAQQNLIDTVNSYIENKGEVDLIARDVYRKYVR